MLAQVSTTIVLVVGASGTPEYGEAFATWAERWEAAAARGGASVIRIGPGATPDESAETDRGRLEGVLAAQPPAGDAPLWFVFLGHGTYDGQHARLNLRGPDVAAGELAEWLAPVERPTAVVVCAAASGPFVNELSRRGRTVVTATKSGQQYSFSRFGDYLSQALGSPQADLDRDAQVSLHEAFLYASAGVEAFYANESRLATEHALLDDNGDGLGTPARWFRGVRSTRKPEGDRLADGVLAHRLHLIESANERALPLEMRRERDDLERRIEKLRLQKEDLPESDYYRRLEELMLRLARLYASAGGG